VNFLDWAESHVGILSRPEKSPEIRSGPKVRDENSVDRNSGHPTDQIRLNRKENDFNEINLRRFQEKLTKLSKELDQPSNVSIQQDSASLVNTISVVVSSGKCVNFLRNIKTF